MKRKIMKNRHLFTNKNSNTNKDFKYFRRDEFIVKLVFSYNHKNNFADSDTWQENYDRFKIHMVFDKWYFTRKDNVPFDFNELMNDLKKELPSMKRVLKIMDNKASISEHNDIGKELEYPSTSDLRTGIETYGFDNIDSDLSYINSKWSCQFRLRWLIEVVELDWTFKEVKCDGYDGCTEWVPTDGQALPITINSSGGSIDSIDDLIKKVS